MQIKIFSRSKAKSFSYLDKAKDFVFISIIDIGSRPLKINKQNTRGFYTFQFNDEDEDAPGAPQIEDIQRLIRVFEDNKHKENFVVHCEAGICRSSAVALALYCHRNGCNFDNVIEQFRDDIGWIMPNTRIVEMFDNELCFNGELISICTYINQRGVEHRC